MAAFTMGGTGTGLRREPNHWDVPNLSSRFGNILIEGVRVREVWEEFDTMRLIARRADGKIFFVNKDSLYDGVKISWKPIEESWSNCISCGQRHPAQFFDDMGRCGNTQTLRSKTIHKLFMERVKKHGKQLSLR